MLAGAVSFTICLTCLFIIVVINLENIGRIMSTTEATTEPPILNFIFLGSMTSSAWVMLIYGIILVSLKP